MITRFRHYVRNACYFQIPAVLRLCGGTTRWSIPQMKSAMNRRHFLKGSLAAGAALTVPQIIPAAAFGQGDTPPPSEQITIGCIGVGRMGRNNLNDFIKLPDCRIVAVCDTYQENLALAKDIVDTHYQNTDCATYGDFRDLLARADIDAVIIAVQDHWHGIIATAAARAGKDIYCEKPLGISIAESRAILDAVRSHNRVLQTGTWQRSLKPFQHACTLARNGYLGTIHTVEVGSPGPDYYVRHTGDLDGHPVPDGFDWNMWRGPAPEVPYNPGRVAWPDWYLIYDYCVGFITNWGVHHLDIANWGCPRIGREPFEVVCKETFRSEGFTNNSKKWDARFHYADGLTMIFQDDHQGERGTRFIGDEGWVRVDRDGIWAGPQSLLKVEFKDTDQRLTDSVNHGANLLECIRTRKKPVSDVEEGHIASCLGMVADIAGRTEARLAWDPKTERFLNNDEANALLSRELHNGWTL